MKLSIYSIHHTHTNFLIGVSVQLRASSTTTYSNTAITVHVNLPAGSEGFKGWFFGTDSTKVAEKEPIQLQVYQLSFNVQEMTSRMIFDL